MHTIESSSRSYFDKEATKNRKQVHKNQMAYSPAYSHISTPDVILSDGTDDASPLLPNRTPANPYHWEECTTPQSSYKYRRTDLISRLMEEDMRLERIEQSIHAIGEMASSISRESHEAMSVFKCTRSTPTRDLLATKSNTALPDPFLSRPFLNNQTSTMMNVPNKAPTPRNLKSETRPKQRVDTEYKDLKRRQVDKEDRAPNQIRTLKEELDLAQERDSKIRKEKENQDIKKKSFYLEEKEHGQYRLDEEDPILVDLLSTDIVWKDNVGHISGDEWTFTGKHYVLCEK
ncbi:hypothetical protein CLU79DRAFT_716024 [Phycomyces nitens]|nr:hypothetical protein CLU79DRAFT_716024 [Phycomyces nitens]